jgi:flagellar biosynthetic protein FliQ
MSTMIAISAAREMLIVVLTLVTPFLLAAILSSIVVGIFQASTRINDLTLSFVPRFAAVLLVIYFAAPWAFAEMIAYIERSAMTISAFPG